MRWVEKNEYLIEYIHFHRIFVSELYVFYLCLFINILHHLGDGDSSVIKRLRIEKPYGPNFVIKKFECTNHLLRNYINRMLIVAICGYYT